MCNECDSFLLDCGSPTCLTGDEIPEKQWLSHKGKRLPQPKKVEGFEKLTTEQQELFTAFLDRFYRGWEFPEEHCPVNVAATWDEGSGNYLRVDFKDGMWLHVKDPRTWY
ncbi:hypothetical protein Desaci_1377 [Desulfosporosinus acidiphilus SJ4]|uniref:Uncharacterized protein n=1 Tax=Desulfosporosinus acidiphilus (strain DSM 22704 / JCM 16185 / SJ4) TaxID=646529 RepID=I4D3M6_DESAJ|nr:hypothetical protein [Desulfosporosinus acidiphilus]AFM40400.1 hypothetical protein Desaci_1377 [Desulfosporosinus acidiphilus SJ4]